MPGSACRPPTPPTPTSAGCTDRPAIHPGRRVRRGGPAGPQRALQITETALGPNHPTTAIWLDNLAVTYRALGRADEAVPLEERARQIREGRSAQTGGPE